MVIFAEDEVMGVWSIIMQLCVFCFVELPFKCCAVNL